MAASNSKLERIGIGLIFCLALLMFFAPLVSVREPIAGDHSCNGYNLGNRLSVLRANLDKVISSANEDGATTVVPAAERSAVQPAAAPFSLQIAWLIPWLILAASACAVLALLVLFFSQNATRIFGLAGGAFGVLAIFHISTMGADLRSWTLALGNSGALGSSNNPLLATRILMVDSFQVNPQAGLFALSFCMFLATFLSYTGAIPRVTHVLRRHRRVNLSEPIRVRPVNPAYPEDNCVTVDVSADGLYFESAADHYYVGMEVFFTRNAGQGSPSLSEEHGSVVRVRTLQNGKHGVAVQILSANQPTLDTLALAPLPYSVNATSPTSNASPAETRHR